MGSVPDLYTTGDNDPELYPVQYYRHYLYCNACGSFELDNWTAPDDAEAIETWRGRLESAALYLSPLPVVAAHQALGFVPPLSVLAILVAGISLALVLFSVISVLGKPKTAARWSFFKLVFPWLLIAVLAEWLVDTGSLFVSPWWVLAATVAVVIALLLASVGLDEKIEIVGMRCKPCGATYAHGTPFFTDLDANPRGLTVADVPRPLGVSPFLVGESVDSEPPEPPSRLPS